jgi:hypothetical protein
MQTSSLFPRHGIPKTSLPSRSEVTALTSPSSWTTLLDKAWSSDGWKMILGAALLRRDKKFRAANFCRQALTIATDFGQYFY